MCWQSNCPNNTWLPATYFGLAFCWSVGGFLWQKSTKLATPFPLETFRIEKSKHKMSSFLVNKLDKIKAAQPHGWTAQIKHLILAERLAAIAFPYHPHQHSDNATNKPKTGIQK